MTSAYAQEWPGRGAREQWGRGCGPEKGGHDRHGESHGHGEGHGPQGHRGGRGRGGRRGGPDFPVEALIGWAMTRGKSHGPRHHGPLDPQALEHLEEMVALRQMRGGRGGGPFGRGPRGRGRRRRGDVRLAVLRLLAEEPRNGYGLMQTIEERSGGQWRPSPGSMYPTLAQLEDEGLIRSTEVDGGRRFEITDAGHTSLEERAGEPDPWTPAPDADESAMTELGPLVLGIGRAVWQVASVGTPAQRERAAGLLAETRRGLYGILAEEPGEPEDGEGRAATGGDDDPASA